MKLLTAKEANSLSKSDMTNNLIKKKELKEERKIQKISDKIIKNILKLVKEKAKNGLYEASISLNVTSPILDKVKSTLKSLGYEIYDNYFIDYSYILCIGWSIK